MDARHQNGRILYAWIPLPWATPPLTANQRHHWARRAQIVKETRNMARYKAREKQLPKCLKKIRVELHYYPQNKRRRDADNLVPTLKALCDGLVDYGIVKDDTPEYMEKIMPIIHTPRKPAELKLYIEWQEEAPDTQKGNRGME
ncbi:RusA family crossover junction endodeoxyribonuclease [Corynebacterium poyangense]|uniref:hypothetical protein n=1 Tax=Corynebacterium poyangense TaxID=2684405 RepID=UPI00165CF967|nr:hypothetical protein [Corynebacterium poyangense]